MTYLAADRPRADALAAHLLEASPRESGTFATLHVLKRGSGTRFVLGGAIDVGVEWDTQSEASLTPTGSMISAAVSAAQANRTGLAFIHTHPLDSRSPRLSAIDRETTMRLGATFAELIDGPFASLVISPGGWGGALYDKDRVVNFERICLVGRRLALFTTSERPGDAALDGRQRQALGYAGNSLLRQLRAVIVGVGGLGAPLAETLVRMGTGSVVLIDDDVLEPSNVRRVFGVTLEDAERRRPKVEAVAAGLDRLQTGTTIAAVRGDVREAPVQQHLLDCDLVFSTTDTHSSRAALTELAARGSFPLIDLGVRVGVRGNGELDALLFERRIQLPEGPCLWCWRKLDSHRVRLELMSEFERSSLVADGYVAGLPGEPEPSVAALTVAAAGAGAAALLGLLTGGLERAPLGSSVELLRCEAYPFERQEQDPECICARWRPT